MRSSRTLVACGRSRSHDYPENGRRLRQACARPSRTRTSILLARSTERQRATGVHNVWLRATMGEVAWASAMPIPVRRNTRSLNRTFNPLLVECRRGSTTCCSALIQHLPIRIAASLHPLG